MHYPSIPKPSNRLRSLTAQEASAKRDEDHPPGTLRRRGDKTGSDVVDGPEDTPSFSSSISRTPLHDQAGSAARTTPGLRGLPCSMKLTAMGMKGGTPAVRRQCALVGVAGGRCSRSAGRVGQRPYHCRTMKDANRPEIYQAGGTGKPVRGCAEAGSVDIHHPRPEAAEMSTRGGSILGSDQSHHGLSVRDLAIHHKLTAN